MWTVLAVHASIPPHSVGDMTIPQIEAVMRRLGKHISLKLGIPLGEPEKIPDTPPKLSQIQAFCNAFNGM